MRLKHIKLAGFKSFVEPTKVPFEHQMTAIVGPNGCGKSNIIDAVRWVLGESSAKNLRGDAMTDVIFNGAATRKPVGQASVELLFDNLSGQISGSMADRNQVAIRRVVNRDGQNSYYLNGSKCRRKDITDIFLGTGLGPRSYAIIEQGTISRLIESKPQELRVFIEEAAGISKYKERRRETETKIRHTRENLTRLTDIRFELTQQLDKLHQQAQAAKRFKQLKTQERKLKAELTVLRWQKYDRQFQDYQHQQDVIEQQINQLLSAKAEVEQAALHAKQQSGLLNRDILQLQQQKITLTEKIAKLEQQLNHAIERQTQMQQDKTQFIQQLQFAQQALISEQQQEKSLALKQTQESERFLSLQQQLTELEQQLASDNESLNEKRHAWYQIQKSKEQNNTLKQNWLTKQTKLQTQKQQSSLRLTQLDEQHQQLSAQADELTSQNTERFKQQAEQLAEKIALLVTEVQQNNQQMVNVECEIKRLNQLASEYQGSLQASDKQIEYIEHKLSIKENWQQAQQSWLASVSSAQHNTVQESIDVEAGWELAAEMVLAELLKASTSLTFPLEVLQQHPLPPSLVLLRKPETGELVLEDSLAAKIQGESALIPRLNLIKVADTISDALAMVPALSDQQSVICRQGLWLSHHFIRYGICDQKNDHLLLQKELNAIIAQRHQLIEKHSANEQQLEQCQDQLLLLKRQLQEIMLQQSSKQQRLSQIEQQQALAEQTLHLVAQQLTAVTTEQQQLQQDIAEMTQQLAQVEQQLTMITADAMSEPAIIAETETLTSAIEQLQQDVKRQQSSYNLLQQDKHQAELALEKTKHQSQHSAQSIVRLQENIKQLSEQQAKNNVLIQRHIQPLADDQTQLKCWLEQMEHLDLQLKDKQLQLQSAQQNSVDTEQSLQQTVETMNELTVQLNQHKLESETSRLKAQSMLEQLQEMAQTTELVLQNMPAQARESQWQAQIAKLAKDIQRLGAINLAAIDEFEAQIERKNYLDQQDQDLNLAITTLESAIAKIDNESRHKFKLTFDKINQDLQALFPKVFGGGSAYLSLTDDDLLETGIHIMARPPGKKK